MRHHRGHILGHSLSRSLIYFTYQVTESSRLGKHHRGPILGHSPGGSVTYTTPPAHTYVLESSGLWNITEALYWDTPRVGGWVIYTTRPAHPAHTYQLCPDKRRQLMTLIIWIYDYKSGSTHKSRTSGFKSTYHTNKVMWKVDLKHEVQDAVITGGWVCVYIYWEVWRSDSMWTFDPETRPDLCRTCKSPDSHGSYGDDDDATGLCLCSTHYMR